MFVCMTLLKIKSKDMSNKTAKRSKKINEIQFHVDHLQQMPNQQFYSTFFDQAETLRLNAQSMIDYSLVIKPEQINCLWIQPNHWFIRVAIELTKTARTKLTGISFIFIGQQKKKFQIWYAECLWNRIHKNQRTEWMTRQFFWYYRRFDCHRVAVYIMMNKQKKKEKRRRSSYTSTIYILNKHFRTAKLIYTAMWYKIRLTAAAVWIDFVYNVILLLLLLIFFFVSSSVLNVLVWAESKTAIHWNDSKFNDIVRWNQDEMSGFILWPIHGLAEWFDELERLWRVPKRISS